LALAPALALSAWAGAQTAPQRIQPAGPPQQKSQKELIEQRDAKLAKEVFTKAPWIKDWDAARAEAKKTGKPVFAYFTRSFAP
jgi:hypothetical protein